MNKKQAAIYERFIHSGLYFLNQCYTRYSPAKANAYEYCLYLAHKHNAFTPVKIISYNTQIFTAGFCFTDEKTGFVKFMYITPSYDRTWKI